MEETVRKVSAIFDKMASVKITPTSNYSVPEYWMNRAIKGDEKCKDNLFNWISLILNIDKSILNAVFNAKYNKTNENKVMNKKLIRLSESDLHRIVKKSVNKAINEMYQKEFEPIYYQVEEAYYSLDKACDIAKKMYGKDIIVDKLNSALDELEYVYHICRQRQEIGD